MSDSDIRRLIRAAKQAKKQAYVPYSGFHVGAALLCSDGTVYTGCNIENASFSVTNCAERTALFKAVSDGHRAFAAIAVVSDSKEITPPCGACRQALAEFCGSDFVILMCGSGSDYRQSTLGELLPFAFSL